MPRNSAGVYSLPAGNPVVTGTVISSTWANTTLTDIGNEITQSLDRSGDGGMLAPLQLADGTAGAPGLTWSTEPTSGLYRAAAADFRYSVTGTDRVQITANGLRTTDGTVALPGYSFISDTDTGIFRNAADAFRLVTGGVARLLVTSTNIEVNAIPTYFFAGTVGAPGLAFATDIDTGIFLNAADAFRLVTGGVARLLISSTSIEVNAIPAYFFAGTAGAPGVSFATDIDTGIYKDANNDIKFSTGGVFALGIDSNQRMRGGDGTAALPYYTFLNDNATGFYRDTANQIGISLAGATAGQVAQGSYTGTLTGCTTSPTVAVAYQRVGNHVALNIPALSATSNTTAVTITGAPAVIRPSTTTGLAKISRAMDNTVNTFIAEFDMNNSGTITLYQNGSSTGWTAAGTKGIPSNVQLEYYII